MVTGTWLFKSTFIFQPGDELACFDILSPLHWNKLVAKGRPIIESTKHRLILYRGTQYRLILNQVMGQISQTFTFRVLLMKER